MTVNVTVEKPDATIIFPRENASKGLSYELNWSLCGSGVVPQGKSFRNLKVAELAKLGGTSKEDVPKAVPWTSALEQEVTAYLGSENVTRYVQDSALGALLSNEVPVRIVSDSAAATLNFKTWLSTTKTIPLPQFQEAVTVLVAANFTSKGPIISYGPKSKMIIIAGTANLEPLLDFFPQASAEAFLALNVLPLWGSLVGGNFFVSKGFDANATIKHGTAFSAAGFCRLFMGSIANGKVKDEYKAFPNSLPLPKSVVFFANDATAVIPPAAKLTAAQAAFYYVAACSPPGVANFSAAARLVAALGAKSEVYLVNRGAFATAAAADAAALTLPGKKGSAGALGLEVVSVEGETKAPAAGAAATTAKALQTAVDTRCKGLDAIIAAGPKI